MTRAGGERGDHARWRLSVLLQLPSHPSWHVSSIILGAICLLLFLGAVCLDCLLLFLGTLFFGSIVTISVIFN